MIGNLSVSTTSTFTGRITCGDIAPLGTGGIKLLKLDGTPAIKIFDTGAAQFYSNVTTDGNLTVAGELSAAKGPWFCAGRVNTAAGTIISNYGRVSFLCGRDAQASVTITMASAHPQGINYAAFASSSRAFSNVEGTRTSTTFQIVLRNSDFSTLANDTNTLTFMVV